MSADRIITPEETCLLLEQEFQCMLEEAHHETHFGDEIGDQFVGDDLPKEFDEEEDNDCWDCSVLENSEYRPYPNKTVMMLDVIDNLPRCRFSSAQIQLGAPDVPSLKGFRKMQQMLQSTCGNEPVKITSQFGNVFYMNDICETLACDMANPLVAPHMHFYPEETDCPISETYQAERWLEYTLSQLTPMFSKGHKQFWIEELAQLKDGTYVIPHTLIVRNGELTSDVSTAKKVSDGRWKLVDQERTIKADDFELDYNDMIAHFGTLVWDESAEVSPMPNEMRKLVADDEDLFVIMASPWADDVSGNKSKQYNKHMNMYTGNSCLPGRLLQQEFHVHYISSSPNASSAEQFSAFRDHVNSTEKEPQSEEASHIGGNANLPCRKCQWGGTQIEKETAEALTEHQQATGTKDKITQHWIEILLAKSKALKTENRRRTATEISTELRTWLEAQPGEKMNPLLDICGLDPSQDTSVELLHTIFLGVIKYIWHHLNTDQWSDEDRHLLAIRMQSTDLTGLTVPPVRAGYMIQYKNNLIGKHFKTLMQILAFHVHDISTPDQFTMIKAAGELGARLWIPEIDNMTEYLEDLKIAIGNLLDAFDKVDPLQILAKIKLHLLVHVPDDIRRFGPLIHWATEIYESHNTVFRLCLVLSNRLAPSQDIALKFASMDRVKHFLSGGYWWDPVSKRWAQTGRGVQRILLTDPVFQRHLGWTAPPKIIPGFVKAMPIKSTPPVKWSQTQASLHWTGTNGAPSPESHWQMGQVLTAQSGDKAVIGSWVFARNSKGVTVIGRVSELWVGEKSFIMLEHFICTDQPHPDFGWPVLRRPNGAEIISGQGRSYIVLEAKFVQFVCSVQHDCRMGSCKPGISRKERQEREETNRDTMLIKHSDDDQFILNMSALHNFFRLRRVLPQSLTKLTASHEDRLEFHKKMAAQASSTCTKKRKKTAEKRRATAAAKRTEAELAAVVALEAEEALRCSEEGDDDSDEQQEHEGEAQAAPDSDKDSERDTEEEEERSVSTRKHPNKRKHR
ncbi:hypothetical protein B0H19DRAFT_1204789 [Mycena capillaripes]|nr:hypothetical protein B0H19DRAFT_1204789 [Mycena capillaripes]